MLVLANQSMVTLFDKENNSTCYCQDNSYIKEMFNLIDILEYCQDYMTLKSKTTKAKSKSSGNTSCKDVERVNPAKHFFSSSWYQKEVM